MTRLLTQKVALSLTGTILFLGLAEVALRVLLFGMGDVKTPLHDPARFADSFSDDDYWKLYNRWGGEFKAPEHPHPLLGWVNSVGDTLLHVHTAWADGRRPVLLYGDSFAECAGDERCFEHILNEDPEFTRNHYLLNYGTGGYGVDQIYLLIKETINLYKDPLVVFSFMTTDLDRSVLSVRIGQKPYFVVAEGELLLQGVPIEPDANEYFATHPPEIRSYLVAMATQSELMPAAWRDAVIGTEEILRRKKEVSGRLIAASVETLRVKGIEPLVVVFHHKTDIWRASWRVSFIDELLEELSVTSVSSLDVFREHFDDLPIRKLISATHGHPTTLYNELISAEIKRWVMSQDRSKGEAAIPTSSSSPWRRDQGDLRLEGE